MILTSAFALAADTVLFRPVAVPAPWYSVATGVLSIVVTVLLLGIAAGILGMARALKGAERNLGGRLQGLSEELIPLARNLNQIATQLADVTTSMRGDLKRLSGTVGVVDDAVRDAIDASEARLRQFGTMLDAVQDEAQATVASATGAMRGVRMGAGSLISSLFGANDRARDRGRRRRPSGAGVELEERDVMARLAALEAAFAAADDDEEDDEGSFTDDRKFPVDGDRDDERDDERYDEIDDDDDARDDEDDDGEADTDDDDDEREDQDDDDDENDLEDDEDDEDELDDDEDELDDDTSTRPGDDADASPAGVPRSGGPRIKSRRRP